MVTHPQENINTGAPGAEAGTDNKPDSYTRRAGASLEQIAARGASLGGRKTALLTFIVRKTFLYCKAVDQISLSQFEAGTGIGRKHLSRLLEDLQRGGMIRIRRGQFRGCKTVTRFAINENFDQWPNCGLNVPASGDIPSNGDIPSGGVGMSPYKGNKCPPPRGPHRDIHRDSTQGVLKPSVRKRPDGESEPTISTAIKSYFQERFQAFNGHAPALPSKGDQIAVAKRVNQLVTADPGFYTEQFFRDMVDHFLTAGQPDSLAAMLKAGWLNGFIKARTGKSARPGSGCASHIIPKGENFIVEEYN